MLAAWSSEACPEVAPIPAEAMRHGEEAQRLSAAEDYEGARREICAALAIVERGPKFPWDRPVFARAVADGRAILGEIDLQRGRPDLALASVEDSHRRYAELVPRDSPTFAISLSDLAVVHEKLGRLAESEAELREAIAIGHRIGIGVEERAKFLNNLALTLEAAGRPGEADEALREAMSLDGLPDEIVRLLEQELSYHMYTRGEYAATLVAMTEQYDRVDPGSIDAAHLAGGIAQSYSEMQNPAEAQRWFRRAVEIRRRRQPGSQALALELFNLSEALGDDARDEADALLDEASGLAEAIVPGSRTAVAIRAAKIYRLIERDEPGAAVVLGEQTVATAPDAGRHLLAVHLFTGLGHHDLGRPDLALRAFELARDLGTRISPRLPDLRIVHTALGQLLLELGDLGAAAQSFDRAIEVAESMRPGSADEPGLEAMFGQAQSAYHGRIRVAWQRGTPAEAAIAFRTAESFRARTLAELLSRASRPPTEAAAPVVAELDSVRGELSALYQQEETGPSVLELEQRAERLRLRLRALDPQAADQEYPQPAELAEVQRRLDPAVTMAVYEVTDDEVYLFAVRRDSLTFHRLEADAETIGAAVGEVVTACLDRESKPPLDALRKLGEWLLRPIADRLGALTVGADGVLATLPFEALELDGVVLAERSTVRSIPSATILARFGGRGRTPRRAFAGFAAPETPGQALLPGTRREVREAAAILGDDGSAIDEAVTAASVRRRAPGARYVHFAVHGLIRDEQPLFSGFAMADGGFLPAYELSDLDLSADLVVCSACETAKGEFRAGEGTVGLAYALFTAGARAVLVSRWPLADTLAPKQTGTLYRRLVAGAPAAQAVRDAALEMRRTQPHPREWAAFTLIDLDAGLGHA